MSTARMHLTRFGTISLACAALIGSAAAAGAATTSPGAGAGAAPATLGGIKSKATADITDRVHALNWARPKSTQPRVSDPGRPR